MLKLNKPPTYHHEQKYHKLCVKAKTLIPESHEIYFSSLDSDLMQQLKRFWSFFKLENIMLTFPETLSLGIDNQQGPQARMPQQIAKLFNSYFASVLTVLSEVCTLSAPFTLAHPT